MSLRKPRSAHSCWRASSATCLDSSSPCWLASSCTAGCPSARLKSKQQTNFSLGGGALREAHADSNVRSTVATLLLVPTLRPCAAAQLSTPRLRTHPVIEHGELLLAE